MKLKNIFKKIDQLLLPNKDSMRLAPYIWLIYLFIFFMSIGSYHPVPNSGVYASIGTILFLVFYFHGYQASSQKIHWNILAILIIGSVMAMLSPGASVFFVYAGAFCCRLGSGKKAFYGLAGITIWIALLSLWFNHPIYFYLPAIIFSLMIGGMNIYQHDIDLKRKELILSQKEVKHLARTSERERIARDLHDLIGHTFSVITLKAELIGKLIDKNTIKAKSEVLELENISRNALKQVREVVTGYRTSDLSTELAHAKYVLESNDIHFEYQFDELTINESTNKELAIILKELITNILKHAEASKVVCKVSETKNDVILQVIDDGKGFKAHSHLDAQDQKPQNNGYGLKGINERVSKMKGRMIIESKAGSNLIVSIPKNNENTTSKTEKKAHD
jgi:two-component system sensor histidine kinase DesK